MNNYGIVYEIKKDKAVVLTQNRNFIMIRSRQDMSLGQQITYDDKDIYRLRKKYYKYASICAGLAAVCVLMFAFFRIMMPGDADIYGYVAVDINPSMEFCINKDFEVLEVVSFNEDAAKLIKDLEVLDRSIETVIIDIITEAKKYGYIKAEEKAEILISASLKDVNKDTGTSDGSGSAKIDNLLDEIEREIEGKDRNIVGNMLQLTCEEREAALKHDISMGKYHLFLKSKEQGKDISIEEINAMNVSDIMKVVDIEVYESTVHAGNEHEYINKISSTPEEVSENEKTSKNSVTPIRRTTPVKSLNSSPNPLPTATSKNTLQPTAGTDENSSFIPPNGTASQNTVESSRKLNLKHYNEEQSVSSQAIRWDFVLENTGNEPIDLKNVKVRYYFKEDIEKAINFAVYFYSLGEEKTDVKGKIYNITKSDSTNRYLEVTFEKGSISPGESAWVFGAMYREDWTDFNQEDDWSFYKGNSTFSDWNRMTVYFSDNLVWGIEPY